MALEELEGETYTLFVRGSDLSPAVYLSVEEVETRFVVDTGCARTTVTRKQVEEWGLEDEIVPDGEDFVVTAHFEVLDGCSVPVYVRDMPWSLLGLDVLSMYNCVLDLKEGKLTFRKFQVLNSLPEPIIRTFNINGKDVEVLLDTGQVGYLLGGPQLAEKAGLQMEDVSDQGLVIETPKGILPVQYKVPEVCVRGYGKESFCTLYACSDEEYLVVGIKYLLGFTIRFNGNIYDVSFAGENPEEEAEESQPDAEAAKESSQPQL